MRIAAYCRVSTEQEEQINSFESQKCYFREYIKNREGWELYEIYADEGITGTSTEKRAAFNRMMHDARQHRFDLILTKEVSRFSRNILDAISYTRILRNIGIGVLFMNDGIYTMDADAELRLSIISSIAQEESRKTSSRVKWGQTRRMEQGVVFGRSMLGYDVVHGRMTVNLEGARLVRMIYEKYLYERKGTATIARELREAGIKTFTGNVHWSSSVILRILKNEKYCGDLKQKKTYTPDYLTHRKKYNKGQEEFIFLLNHHEAIIPREMWEETQREITRRNPSNMPGGGHGNRYPFSGKIKCGACGGNFVSRTRKRGDGLRYRVWRCGRNTFEGKRHTNSVGEVLGCDCGGQFRDDDGMKMLKGAVAMLKIDREAEISHLFNIVKNVLRTTEEGQSEHEITLKKRNLKNMYELKEALNAVEKKKLNVLDAFFSSKISEADMKLVKASYDNQIAELTQLIKVNEVKTEMGDIKRREENPEKRRTFYSNGISEQDIRLKIEKIVRCEEAPDSFFGSLLEGIVVYPDRKVNLNLKFLSIQWNYRLIRH